MRNFASTISLFLLVTVLRADCPTPTVSYSWQVGLGVSYNFPDSGPPPPAYTNLSISALGIGDD